MEDNNYCGIVPLSIKVETSTQATDTSPRFKIQKLLDNIQYIQYIPRNMHTVLALLCFVVVIHWLISPYPSGLLHWHCGNLTIAPVQAKQPWWLWVNTSCEFIMNDCITTTKQSTTKPCAYFLGYTVKRVIHMIRGSLGFIYDRENNITTSIDPSHKPCNIPDKYPSTDPFVAERCTGARFSLINYTAGHETGALWDLCNSSIKVTTKFYINTKK